MQNLVIQNLPTAYEYDVFISYKRSFLIESWVTKFFLKFFQEWLRKKLLELGEPQPHIFFDQSNIEPGDPWPQRLRRAIQTSKHFSLSVCAVNFNRRLTIMKEPLLELIFEIDCLVRIFTVYIMLFGKHFTSRRARV